jgi:hypothetical protein
MIASSPIDAPSTWAVSDRWEISDRAALLPLGHCLRVDPAALGQSPQALLTTLYRSTDRLCRRGTAVKNLAQDQPLEVVEVGPDSARIQSGAGMSNSAIAQSALRRHRVLPLQTEAVPGHLYPLDRRRYNRRCWRGAGLSRHILTPAQPFLVVASQSLSIVEKRVLPLGSSASVISTTRDLNDR